MGDSDEEDADLLGKSASAMNDIQKLKAAFSKRKFPQITVYLISFFYLLDLPASSVGQQPSGPNAGFDMD